MSRPTRPRTPPPRPPEGTPEEPREVAVHRPAARPAGSAQRRRAVRAAGVDEGSAGAARSAGRRPSVRSAGAGGARAASTAAPPVAAPAPRKRSSRAPAPAAPVRVADLAGARLARRGHPARRLLVAGAVLVVLAVLAGWVLLGSPWLRVADVRVTGTARTDRGAVEALVEGQRGSPLLSVDTGRLAAAVRALPLVASVDVTRSWPSTLRVDVHEREAVAAVPSVDGGFDLVDADARVLVQVEAAPAGVPTLAVDVATAGVDALQAALDVNGTLPSQIRSRVSQISATGPEAVSLQVVDGPLVRWGGSERPERKAEVLLRMLQDRAVASAKSVDVSAPDSPSIVP